MKKKGKEGGTKIPQYFLAAVFIMFIAATGFFSMKNYWDVRTSGTTETADGFRLENTFEENFSILLWQEEKYVESFGLAAKWMGQPVLNEEVKLKNGYLTEVEELAEEEILRKNAEDLGRAKQYIEEQGGILLYVQTPYKISKFDDQLPVGITDCSNENIDTFLSYLDEYGVETLDIRQTMHDEGINQYDYFYKTDHHWTPEAGFYAFRKISDYIEEAKKISVDAQVKELDNYRIDNYEKWHLGSNGQRVGVEYGGIDDFHVVIPEFDTLLTNVETQEMGSYYDILIEDAVLKEQGRATYDIAYGNSIGYHFYNHMAENDARVLVVSDSMGKVTNPFLILAYQNVYTMGYSLTTQMIDEFQPDVVVYITHHMYIDGEDCFNIFQ